HNSSHSEPPPAASDRETNTGGKAPSFRPWPMTFLFYGSQLTSAPGAAPVRRRSPPATGRTPRRQRLAWHYHHARRWAGQELADDAQVALPDYRDAVIEGGEQHTPRQDAGGHQVPVAEAARGGRRH